MANKALPPTTLLGSEIVKRLEQLGLSRRELCRRVDLSRQTLHLLEHVPGRDVSGETFNAVDRGLRWPPGTTKGYYEGDQKAKERQRSISTSQMIDEYMATILQHLASMSIDELEREVLMLEEEAYGRRPVDDDDAIKLISETVKSLRAIRRAGETNRS